MEICFMLNQVILQAIFVASSYGDCSVSNEHLHLRGPYGNISYQSINIVDSCYWHLPTSIDDGSVLFLSVIEMDMTYLDRMHRWCSGHLYLPDKDSGCRVNDFHCNFYTHPKSTCDLALTLAKVKELQISCPEYSWHMLKRLPTEVSLLTSDVPRRIKMKKSFKMQYRYFTCSGDELKNSTLNHDVTPEVCNSTKSTSLVAALAAVSILLLSTCVYIGVQIIKKRRDNQYAKMSEDRRNLSNEDIL